MEAAGPISHQSPPGPSPRVRRQLDTRVSWDSSRPLPHRFRLQQIWYVAAAGDIRWSKMSTSMLTKIELQNYAALRKRPAGPPDSLSPATGRGRRAHQRIGRWRHKMRRQLVGMVFEGTLALAQVSS